MKIASVLAFALAPLLCAGETAPALKLATREELRFCLLENRAIEAKKQSIQVRSGKRVTAMQELQRRQRDLAAMQAKAKPKNQIEMEAIEQIINRLNAEGARLNQEGDVMLAEAKALNESVIKTNLQCAGIAVQQEDIDAVERELARKL